MSYSLNEGPGVCQGTHRLVIKPVLAAIALGSSPDIMSAGLQAIHQINRRGDINDRIAVGLPLMGNVAGAMFPGHELEAVGSEAALGILAEHEMIRMLARRGALDEMAIEPVWMGVGEVGAAYVRDRSPVKHTAGWVRRSQARAVRRGKPIGKPVAVRAYDASDMVSFSYGDTVLHVQEKVQVFTGAPIVVSSYGFSTLKSPAVLPVLPAATKTKTLAEVA